MSFSDDGGMQGASGVPANLYQRGFIYQDINQAKLANRLKEKSSAISLWGFQFHYNPSEISYTVGNSANIDWTKKENLKANLLVGNSSFTLTLLLNRVWDLAWLRDAVVNNHRVIGGKGKTGVIQYANINRLKTAAGSLKNPTPGYGRYVSEDDLYGIYTRGTEWDLEYLYRTLNGDPVKNATVPDSDTSNWGFIAGTPVWIKLNDNMRWKVSVTNLAVTHKQFTQNMVPLLTEVQISMDRLPVVSLDLNETGKIMSDRYSTDSTNSGTSSGNDSQTRGTILGLGEGVTP